MSAFVLTGSANQTDVIRELDAIQAQKDVTLAATACLLNTHKAAKTKGGLVGVETRYLIQLAWAEEQCIAHCVLLVACHADMRFAT